MSDQWRDRYDSWKTDAGTRYADVLDEDGEPVDQDTLDAQAEDAAIERAERQREDMMFDAPEREEWVPYERG
jgi:hypothetical protein